jgi:hypothetical protein
VLPTPTNKQGKQVADWTDDGTCLFSIFPVYLYRLFLYVIMLMLLTDILNWTKASHIEHHYETLKKHHFNGHALAELKALFNPLQPQFFHVVKDICVAIGIDQTGEILQVCAAIRKL